MQKSLPTIERPPAEPRNLFALLAGTPSRRRLALGLAVALAGLVFALLGQQAKLASADQVVAQCNGEMNGGGTEVACTVTIVNYLTSSGSLAATPPSTLTMTRCVGATGPLHTLTCTTAVATLTEPVATVQQCNGSGNGGGGAVVCTVTVTNHFLGAPAPVTAARVYQCVGSIISGPGEPGICLPANTDGVSSVAQATVGQCNGSGNGGTIVAFSCVVATGSTTTPTLSINVDQCNGSGNGGGAVVTCQAAVVNNIILPPTPTATATTTGAAATATSTTTGVAGTTTTVAGTPAGASPGTATGTGTVVGTNTATRTSTVIGTTTAARTSTATGTTTATGTAPSGATLTPAGPGATLTASPAGTTTGTVPGSASTPRAPDTGTGTGSTASLPWPAILALAVLVIGSVSMMVIATRRK